MLGKWIEKKNELPAGIMAIDEKLRPLLQEIHNLNAEDLAEVRVFIGYLSGRSQSRVELDSRVTAKICDFMAGDMQRVG